MNPLLIQIGIIDGAGIYEAMKDYFQALGRKDYARFIRKPAGVIRQLTGEEELARLLNGKSVPITPDMDHEEFLAKAQEVLSSEDSLGMYGNAALKAVESQMAQHKALLQAMQAQAGQIAQANQQQFNAMGVAGGVQPGQAPFMNSYNDFQASRSSLQNQAAGPGGMLPGMQKPAPGGE
jgi:hypothetical protein